MSREIKPSTCTNFPMFSKVKISNTGQSYTTYRDMFTYMGLPMPRSNPFVHGEIGVVVGKAMHESEGYGEVLAVRVEGGVGLISAKGVNKYKEPVVIGKPKLRDYDLAPVTPEAFSRLAPYFTKAPSWATHIGSDSYGVHFFDHHPHIFRGRGDNAFVRGILPDTHRCKSTCDRMDASADLKVLVLPQVEKVVEPTVAELKVEVAALKAKLWDAEQKLKKIAEVAA